MALNARSVNHRDGAQQRRGPARADTTFRRWIRPYAGAIGWTVSVVVVVVLGLWGFLGVEIPPQAGPPRLGVLDSLYRTLRLFTLSLELPTGATPPRQLWVAAFVAPLLTLGGIVELFSDQLREGPDSLLRPPAGGGLRRQRAGSCADHRAGSPIEVA